MKSFNKILVIILLTLAVSPLALAESYTEPLSNLEERAFGQSQTSGNDEERLGVLEQKAYGKVHTGATPLRIAALQYYLGVPAGARQAVGNFRLPRPKDDAVPSPEPNLEAPNANISLPDYQNSAKTMEYSKPRAPLQAGVSSLQLHMAAGDDERFGGLWVGTLASKIDPHVNVFCELHGSGKNFTGTMIWTSTICGGCRRTIAGYFDSKEQACMMRDLKVEALNPRNPAGFCRVDKYAFGVTENVSRLSGWFKSSQCKDEGAVILVRYRE